MKKGTLVIDEIILPITDIWIDKGKLWIQAELQGPVRALEPNHRYRVFGRDGQELTCSGPKSDILWPEIELGATLEFTCSWSIQLHSLEG